MKLPAFGTILISSLFFLSTGCKKDSRATDPYQCASCSTAPEAIAVNDASSKGIYKGIVIGSSGTIKFDVLNGGTLIKAYLTIDGTSAELTSSVTWNGTQAYTAPFTGTLGGQAISITFSVGKDGTDPIVLSANIPGHLNAEFILVKENSATLIECFEGTYKTTKPESGTFNLLLSRAVRLWGGMHRQDGTTNFEDMDGTMDAGGKLFEDGTDYIGTLSGDEIKGTFKDGDNNSVTVYGKRTL